MSTAVDKPAKVASFSGEKKARKTATRAQTLMQHCRDRLREQLAGALPGVMEQVDDALFDLADKADTNQLQSVYFETMRSVRLSRDDIEARFNEELEQAIDQRVRAMTGGEGADEPLTASPESFSLVDSDELEENLAARNIAAKIRNVCHEDLFALERRVALLLGAPNLEGDENPLGPEVLGTAARGAVQAIDATLEIRLLVLKLFDRHLCRLSEQYYCEINDWLVREGVLPDVRAGMVPRSESARRRESERRAPQGREDGAGAGPEGAGDGSHAAGGAGWQAYHGSGGGSGGGSADAGGHAPMGDAAPAGSVFDQVHAAAQSIAGGAGMSGGSANFMPAGPRREQMLGVLDQVMRMGTGEDGAHNAPQREQFIGDLTELQRSEFNGGGLSDGNQIRALRASGAASSVSHSDGLMIDVVAMMFDYILQDPNVGDAMRVLIGRLQIPVLKVAILDKSFFARRTHPARVFINTLAEYGAREEGTDGPVFERVCGLVERILNEFETQVDVFSGALEELESILGEDDQAVEENAWASAKVAEERERLSKARRRAEQEVEQRLEGVTLPDCIADFLRNHWRHLMSERLFRCGENSDEWRAAVVSMERLLWSVTPKPDKAARDRLLALLPFLLEQLKLGMHEIGLSAEARMPFLRALSELHVAALKDPAEADLDSPAATAEPAAEPAPEAVDSDATTEIEAMPDFGPGEYTADLLCSTVKRANTLIWDTAASKPQCEGMGATVVVVKLEAEHLVCAHAGDSRLYRLRDDELEQLSVDHTYRNDVVAKGLASEEEAADIPGNLITRAVGGDALIEPEVNIHDTAPGDLFMVCSDGLSDMVDDPAIATLMRSAGAQPDLEAMANALIEAANAAGGKDNISVGLLRVDHALPHAEGGVPRDYAAFVSAHAATDPGRRRAHNEDAIEADAGVGCVVMADGMGGHNAGEVASAMTVSLLMETLRMPTGPVAVADEPETSELEATGEFDFDSINAQFWDEAMEDEGNTALYDAVAEEVENIVLSTHDDLDSIFDVDSPAASEGLEENAARDPLLAQVLNLAPGTWVEFGEAGGRAQRARLSWVSPEKSRFLFTDRFGQKVSESTAYGLALELRADRLRVLNVVPLFDRVVNRVSRSLRTGDGAQANVA